MLAGGFLLLVALLCLARPASAQTPPPYSGPWEVNDTTSWSGPVTLHGDLVVQSAGELVLRDMQVTFACMERSEFGVRVLGGGRLQATNVTFRAQDPAYPCRFVINTHAVVELQRCRIANVGTFGKSMDNWGVYVHSSSVRFSGCEITGCNVGILVQGHFSPVIESCRIFDNADRGVWSKYATPAILNNTFSNNSYGVFLEESPGPALLNNGFIGNRREAVSMDAASFLGDWAIDRAVRWAGSSVLLRGNLTVLPGGSLALEESSVAVDSGPGSRKSLRVLRGGSLSLDHSTLSPVPGGGDRNFVLAAFGDLFLERSAVHGAGIDRAEAQNSGLYAGSLAIINGSDLSGNLASLVCAGRAEVTNSTLNGSWQDVRMAGGTARMLNVAFDKGKVLCGAGDGTLEAGWYLSAGAVWQNGRGVAGAVLTVSAGGGRRLHDGPAGPDGWVRWMGVETFRVENGSASAPGGVLLSARKEGLSDISRTVDLESNREEALMFSDPSAPSLSVTTPENGSGTNRTTLVVAGTASDDFGLDRVECRLDDSLRWTQLAGPNWSIAFTNLSRGEHRIWVRAVDQAGQATWANLTVTVDTEPPRLDLDEPFEHSVLSRDTGVRFSGRTDPGATLTVMGVGLPVDAAGHFDWIVDVPEGVHTVEVVARDRGGNVAVLTRQVTVDLTSPVITVLSPPNGTRTRLDEVHLTGRVEPGARFRVDGSTVELDPDGAFNVTVLLSGGPKTVELYAEDAAGNPSALNWTLERTVDPQPSPSPFRANWLALAAGAVLLVLGIAALSLFTARLKRRRESPPGSVLPEPPSTRDGLRPPPSQSS
ncbi:MAG: hypothetical protein FJ149_02570 [Euryarchaeota archaeon]|nr:hypothetical protein [Euryarchaeota archaeon]